MATDATALLPDGAARGSLFYMIEELEIPSGDYRLPARLHLPDAAPTAAYVLHPATGVPWDYYARFAEWVAEQGFAILRYRYRSDGQNTAALKASRITMADWGITDQNAALNALADRFPGVELRVIGHSLGGFMTMFHDRANQITRLSAVCSGPAYWVRTPFPRIIGTAAYWHLLGPLACTALGYLPARLLGGTEDLPTTAFYQWRVWCGNRHLHRPQWGNLLPQPDLQAFSGELNLVAVSDDWMIPPPVVADLAGFYPAAEPGLTVIETAAKPIGHLSVFRPRNAAHWPKLI